MNMAFTCYHMASTCCNMAFTGCHMALACYQVAPATVCSPDCTGTMAAPGLPPGALWASHTRWAEYCQFISGRSDGGFKSRIWELVFELFFSNVILCRTPNDKTIKTEFKASQTPPGPFERIFTCPAPYLQVP